MSGELVPKLRIVRCPNCSLLLEEPPEYDVYKCGGCGTTLQAKKRKSVAVNSQSSTQETDAATRNDLDLVSEDKQRSNGKQLVPQDGLKEKVTTSSSGERYLDGNVGRGQKLNENGECSGDQLVPFNLSDEELESESESDIYKLSLRRRRVSNNCCSDKTTHCEIEEINDGNLLPEGSKVELICASDENGNNEKSGLGGAISEMEITGSDFEGEEESNNGNLPEGVEEKLISGSDGEDANKDESALAGANHDVENTGSDLEAAEELNDGNLLLEKAEEEFFSGSDAEDANKDESALAGTNPEVENTGSDLESAEELNDGNLLLEGAEDELISGLDGEDANNDKSALVGENNEVEINGSNTAEEKLNNGKLILEGEEEELNICAPDGEDPNNDQSALLGAKSEVNITESASTIKSSSNENFVPEKESILRVTSGKLEEGVSGNPVSSNKQQKQAQKSIHRSFDRPRSVDTSDTPELINPSSELSGTLGQFSKSPTTRSSYAYDGSLSSYDGMDERFPIHHLDSSENSYAFANGVSERRARKGKGLVNEDLGTQQQSYFPNGKHHVMKDRRENQNKLLESTRHGHRHWMRTKRDDLPPRMPFHRSASQSRYEIGNSSNQMHDELYCSSSFLSPNSYEDNDQEKMKLLSTIYKLQDQLNRTRYMSGETNGRPSTGVSYKGKHISAYHGHDLHEGRFSHGQDYPRCNGRCSHGVNWHQRHKFPRIPYSAEATSSAYRGEHSCFHCCPQERHFSADLSPHVLFQHEELCRSCLGQDCYNSKRSYPSSPRWFTPSKLPIYGRGTKSDDQRQRAPELKKYLRERQNLTKRHYKPVAGGAPFVTCHKCLKLLQLPADFLLFKRAYHQLKCGECSEVLKFSLQNGSHIVSFSPNAIGPPSSDLDDQSEVINSSNLPSASHAKYYHYSHADSISYSDDYGLSISKSYSSGDHVSLTQFNPLHGRECDNPNVPRGTFECITEKEKIASRYSTSSNIPVGTYESAEISSNISGSGKLSSEVEARPPRKSSSLHQLMGYSSPSQVIRGTRSSVEGQHSIFNGDNLVKKESHNSQRNQNVR